MRNDLLKRERVLSMVVAGADKTGRSSNLGVATHCGSATNRLIAESATTTAKNLNGRLPS
jgi:hypothetical protein